MLASRTNGKITQTWSRSTPPELSILLLSNLINLWRFPDFGSLHVFCTAIFNCVSAAAAEPDGRYFSAAHLNVNWGTALHNCFHKYHGILRQREPAAVLAQFQPLFVSHRPYSHHNYLPTMIPTQMISGNDMTVTTIIRNPQKAGLPSVFNGFQEIQRNRMFSVKTVQPLKTQHFIS